MLAVIKEERFESVIAGRQFGCGNAPVFDMNPFAYFRRAQPFNKNGALLIAGKPQKHPGKYLALTFKLPVQMNLE